MAMQRLLKVGKPELAIVGCISAIEWFLNDALPNVRYTSPSGKVQNASRSKIIDKKLLTLLSRNIISQLRILSKRRDEIFHGAPPYRGLFRNLDTGTDFGSGMNVHKEHVQRTLALGLAPILRQFLEFKRRTVLN